MTAIAHSLMGDDILLGGDHAPAQPGFTLGDLLTIQAEAQPSANFLPSIGPQQSSYSYAQAHDAVSQLSSFLHTLKLPHGSVAGLLSPNQPTAVIALLACLNAGLTPLLLPAHERFSPLSALIQQAQCSAIITDDCADRSMQDLAVRLAAACEDVRFVMSFGETTPDGVLSLPQAMRIASPVHHTGNDGNIILVAGADQTLAHLSVDALIATATEHAAESLLESSRRIVCPLRLHTMPALCCGLISALMTGAELHLIDAPDSSALTSALLSTRPVHLLWPGALEDMVDDIPGHALHAVTLLHKTPWERHGHHAMTRALPAACVDAWVFDGQTIAFAGRRSGGPALPEIRSSESPPPEKTAFALGMNTHGQLFATGAAVQGFSADGWIDLSCKAFCDQDGTIVAIEAPAPRRKNAMDVR